MNNDLDLNWKEFGESLSLGLEQAREGSIEPKYKDSTKKFLNLLQKTR